MLSSSLPDMMLSAIEDELHQVVSSLDSSRSNGLYPLLAYHMGWEGEGTGKQATGKRIRPLLLLLTTSAAGGNWESALPAAAAVELIHNFSLIHDDIEDNSPVRRGRPTVWNKWGIPLAINAGDAMFTLAHLSILDLKETAGLETALEAALILQNTSLNLTKGQHLDMSYETRRDLSLDDYWLMVSGKTASLISACTELGALIASTDQPTQKFYQDFGFNLGMAFQALDDALGIWGDSESTGKSAESDLVSGKKSLPVIYALNQKGPFADRWLKGPIQAQEIAELAQQLDLEGARDYTQESAASFTDKALNALASAAPSGQAGELLSELAGRLLRRNL
jgi:geranylgeranyl diphosphate synthase type I